MRIFIALDVPRSVKDEIARIQSALRHTPQASISWTRPEGIHLTLAFLGELDTESLKAAGEVVSAAATHHKSIELRTTNLGVFPNLRRPRVLWLGVDGGEVLMSVQKELEDGLVEQDLMERQRNFHPHLTIGRIKELGRESKLVDQFTAFKVCAYEWTADRLCVMSSDLRPGGAVYSLVHQVGLGNIY